MPIFIISPPLPGWWYIVFVPTIIIFLPPFFKMTGIGKLTTYPNNIWYQVLVRQKLFKNYRTTMNPTPLQSYLPFYEKPCYQSPEETVRDIDTKSFGHCSLTKGATLLQLSRKNPRTSYKSYLPLNIWCKSYMSKSQKPEVIKTWGLLIGDPWPLTFKIRSRSNFKVTFEILTSACYRLSSEMVKDTEMVSGAKCRPL